MKKIRNYSAITAHGDVPARKMVLDLMDRVLQEVDSYQRIRDVMHVEGNVLHVGVKSWNLESKRNIYLLGAGKACNARRMRLRAFWANGHKGNHLRQD